VYSRGFMEYNKRILAITIVLLAFLSGTRASAAHRDMLIFVDGTEYCEQKLFFGIATAELMTALSQKAAPILASTSLIFNVLAHAKEGMKRLMTAGTMEERFFRLVKNPCSEAAPERDKITEQAAANPFVISMFLSDFFTLTAWDIYRVNDSFWLLIPHAYKQKIGLNTASSVKTSYKDAQTGRVLKQHELDLGIKIGGLRKSRNNMMVGTFTHYPMQRSCDIIPALTAILVNKYDLSTATETVVQEDPAYLCAWNFCIVGHGQYSTMNDRLMCTLYPDDVAIQALVQHDKHTILQEIQKNTCLKKPKPVDLSIDKSPLRTFTSAAAGSADAADVAHPLKSMLDKADGYIAGMTLPVFCSMLDFFNNVIKVNVLLYKTCFSGLAHIDLPYLTDSGPKKFNYTIVAIGAGSDVVCGWKPYIANENEKIGIKSDISFANFFDAVCAKALLLGDAVNNITAINDHREVGFAAPNIPMVRYPQTTKFCLLESRMTAPDAKICFFDTQEHVTPLEGKEIVCIDRACVVNPFVLEGSMPLMVIKKRNTLFSHVVLHKQQQNMADIFQAFLTKNIAQQEGKRILIEHLSVLSPRIEPESFFDTLEAGLKEQMHKHYSGEKSFVLQLHDVLVLDNELCIVYPKRRVKGIYFCYKNDYFVMSRDCLTICKLSPSATALYKTRCMLLKSHIKAQQ